MALGEVGLDQPHHDGSRLHVPDPVVPIGSDATLFLRVPDAAAAGKVWARTTVDAEPSYVEAVVDRHADGETWWRVSLPVRNDAPHYRFLLDGGPGGYRWVNGGGVVRHDPTDLLDFRLPTADPPPAWLHDAVCYQIFPDRFASTGPKELPAWAIPAEWDDPVETEWARAVRQVFGGDLAGVEAHLDHLEALGVNLLYLTPIFPGPSSHRYNADTFDRVDPLLGGDAALVSLAKACHARGMRLVGDLTTNHTGSGHDWFRAALADASAPEAEYYYFREHPHDYVGWYDTPTLPKLDHRSLALRAALADGEDSVVGKWLRAPYDLDGWRIDVANQTGRYGTVDQNLEVARAIRRTMKSVRPDAWLVAEHCYDAAADLQGDGWHGTMNYAGFTRPSWCFLADDPSLGIMGFPTATPRQPGSRVAETMRESVASLPWRSVTASLTLLDSHDTPRFRSAVREHTPSQLAGIGLLLAYPGVPMLFAGDEVGVVGTGVDDARRPFPWNHPERWDRALLDATTELVRARRRSAALRWGGLRWVYAGDHTLVFLREAPEERVLVQVSRAGHEPVRLAAGALGGARLEPLAGGTSVEAVDGMLTLPDDGPVARYWRIEP